MPRADAIRIRHKPHLAYIPAESVLGPDETGTMASSSSKLGTFGGVFTPSILTILGVIMYLRLPMIVGTAGIATTIIIIIVAHVISFTTGLSVASIATDKKVRVGGNYYIISRSMGLPIGGTLGLALFVGFSCSISLYLVGFSESFLEYFGWETSLDNIRICGTIALAALAIITWISTSLAIKAQYVIMAAIALSLVSVFFGTHELGPAAAAVQPEAVPDFNSNLMLLFGIFFPAVTGFTTGVQMSGDLRDPQRSIPIGTIAAIVFGLVVYIGLTIFLGMTVDAEQLRTNSTILNEISLSAPLVVAGIWGATLSSAIGSILGAPRILQATSMDGITFRFFAKGHGPANEPRNAMILVIAIAEAGIIYGDLNAIAGIISMFFITTYGFLNLSYAIESFGSTDFRPTFRIPSWIAWLGFATCIAVMTQLNPLASFLAFAVLALVFVYYKRRELTLESGDTWEGVWSSVVRSGLYRLSQSQTHQRNWRPNVMLFSGNPATRPHLMQFAEQLVYRRGILTSFELVENPEAEDLFPQPRGHEHEVDPAIPGKFLRRLEARNVYDAIETITRIYGFSGIEPNTVILGWARNSKNPQRFAELLRRMRELDQNILVMDYDQERGFGKRERIDIWWRAGGNNVTLVLILLKFLQATEVWRGSRARIIVVVDDSAAVNPVQKMLDHVLDEQRVQAAIKVINNGIERRPFHDLLRAESMEADLTLFGLPTLDKDNVTDFVERTDDVLRQIGTVILVSASSFFKPLAGSLGPDSGELAVLAQRRAEDNMDFAPVLPLQSGPATILENVHAAAGDALQEFVASAVVGIEQAFLNLSAEAQELVENVDESRRKSGDDQSERRRREAAIRARSTLLFQSRRLVDRFVDERIDAMRRRLELGLDGLLKGVDAAAVHTPATSAIRFDRAELQPAPGDSAGLAFLKFRARLRARLSRGEPSIVMNIGALVRHELHVHFPELLYNRLETFGVAAYKTASELRQVLGLAHDRLDRAIDGGAEAAEQGGDDPAQRFDQLRGGIRAACNQLRNGLQADLRRVVETITGDILAVDGNRRIRRRLRRRDEARERISTVAERWSRNEALTFNYATLSLRLTALHSRLGAVIDKFEAEIERNVRELLLDKLVELERRLEAMAGGAEDVNLMPIMPAYRTGLGSESWYGAVVEQLRSDVKSALAELPEQSTVISDQGYSDLAEHPFTEVETVDLPLRRLLEMQVESRLIGPVQDNSGELPMRLERSTAVARDVVRSFNPPAVEPDVAVALPEVVVNDPETPVELARRNVERIEGELRKIRTALEELRNDIDARRAALMENLTPYMVMRTAERLGAGWRGVDGRSRLEIGVGSKTRLLRRRLSDWLVGLMYRRSEGVLLARRFQRLETDESFGIEHLINFVEQVTPDAELIRALPSYYRQQFLGRQMAVRELWVGRTAELQQAERAVKRHRRGIDGALLILGEAACGKSDLSRSVASRHFARGSVFNLYAPDDMAGQRTDVDRAFAAGLDGRGDCEDMLRTLPRQSAIIIHDLERWWERRPGGEEALQRLLALIAEFGSRHFFILNADTTAFRFINAIVPMDRFFLGVIECEPMRALDLQQAILLRHRSTGMMFEIEGKTEDKLSSLTLARFFNKIFDYSGGNIGVALRTWVGLIQRIDSDRIVLRAPRKPNLGALESLRPEWLVLLMNITIHKRCRPDQLARIFNTSAARMEEDLNVLRHSGLLLENDQNMLEVAPDIQPWLRQSLHDMEVI